MSVILIVFSILYIVFGTLIALRLHDILKHPDKYIEAELDEAAKKEENEKKHCRFFKNLSNQYSVLNLVFGLVFIAISYGIIVACSFLTAGNDDVMLLDSQATGLFGSLFLGFLVGLAVIPLFVKSTFFAVSVHGIFKAETRLTIWKKTFISLLVVFAVGFPIYALGCNTYAHYNDSGITVSRYFQAGESYTAYDDIQEINIYFSHTKDGEVSALCYELRLSDGKILDINKGSHGSLSKTTWKLHRLIEKKAKCVPAITPLTDVDIEFIKSRSESQAEALRYIFEGFHDPNTDL